MCTLSIYQKGILYTAIVLLSSSLPSCHLLKNLKLPLKDKIVGNKIVEKYIKKQPITTTFANATTEVDIFTNYNPPGNAFQPLSNLNRTTKGEYILQPGLYTVQAKSFCLRAGTYNPARGDGYLYADLSGPEASLIQNILERWPVKHPKIPQSEIQKLIWAIIARVNVKDMAPAHKVTLLLLLDKKELLRLAKNAVITAVVDKQWSKLKSSIPPVMYKIIDAENKLRALYTRAQSTFTQFEEYAVLAGLAPPENQIREISKGRWSYHPKGYFIRYFPSGYSKTQVDVYVPAKILADIDQSGKINSLSFDSSRSIEFLYESGNTTLAALHVSLPGTYDTVIPLPRALQVNHKPITLINAATPSDDSHYRKFLKLSSSASTELKIKLNDKDKAIVFNLMAIGEAIKNQTFTGNNSNVYQLIDHLTTEASNYIVYKSLIEDAGNKSDLILNLPATVAVPANTSKQRLGIANEPPNSKYCNHEDVTIIDYLPSIMESQNPRWNVGASLMRIWKSRAANDKPEFGKPVMDIVTMDWALSFSRIKEIYNLALVTKLWFNENARMELIKQIKKMAGDNFIKLPTKVGEVVRFDPLSMELDSKGVPIAEKYYIQHRAYQPFIQAFLDDLIAALANFAFHYSVSGTITRLETSYEIQLDHVGIFIKDIYDFNDEDGNMWDRVGLASQPLGCWNKNDNSVSMGAFSCDGQYVFNTDFRSWRTCRKMGGDFLVYSDIRKVPFNEVISDIPLSKLESKGTENPASP
jgi:hypothetical protein